MWMDCLSCAAVSAELLSNHFHLHLQAPAHWARTRMRAGAAQRRQLVWELGCLLHLRGLVWVRLLALWGMLHRGGCHRRSRSGVPVCVHEPKHLSWRIASAAALRVSYKLAWHMQQLCLLPHYMTPRSAAQPWLAARRRRQFCTCASLQPGARNLLRARRCEALAAVGLDVAKSEAQLRACEFLLSKQCEDGGWGESYLSCQDKARPLGAACLHEMATLSCQIGLRFFWSAPIAN